MNMKASLLADAVIQSISYSTSLILDGRFAGYLVVNIVCNKDFTFKARSYTVGYRCYIGGTDGEYDYSSSVNLQSGNLYTLYICAAEPKVKQDLTFTDRVNFFANEVLFYTTEQEYVLSYSVS